VISLPALINFCPSGFNSGMGARLQEHFVKEHEGCKYRIARLNWKWRKNGARTVKWSVAQ